MSLEDYLEMLDLTTHQITSNKRGYTSENVPQVLKRSGLETKTCCELARDFSRLLCVVAERPERTDPLHRHRTYHRCHLPRRA
ncbi:hypothetical protein [Novipirellula caenicola]|uniref:HTH merR-type domain-containing protein n=1 Tax=Novipirellula caenicola TaxID=1536901 RepID=A0ABP9VP29_9BACT